MSVCLLITRELRVTGPWHTRSGTSTTATKEGGESVVFSMAVTLSVKNFSLAESSSLYFLMAKGDSSPSLLLCFSDACSLRMPFSRKKQRACSCLHRRGSSCCLGRTGGLLHPPHHPCVTVPQECQYLLDQTNSWMSLLHV